MGVNLRIYLFFKSKNNYSTNIMDDSKELSYGIDEFTCEDTGMLIIIDKKIS